MGIDSGEVVTGIAESRVEPESLCERLKGRLVVLALEQQGAKIIMRARVCRVEGDRPLERRQGVLGLSKPFIGKPQVKEAPGVLNVQRYRVVQHVEGGSVPSLFDIQVPKPRVGGLMAGIQCERFLEELLSVVEAALIEMDHTQVVIRPGIPRIQPKRFDERLPALFGPPPLQEDHAEIQMCRGKIGLEGDCLLQVLFCLMKVMDL